MTTYELWFHELLGAYGVRLEAGRVTGVYGPLPLAQMAGSNPLRLRYDERPESIQRVHNGPEQLCMLEQWRKSGWVTPRSAPRPGIIGWALTQLRQRPRARG
jgi:hypothetical protein